MDISDLFVDGVAANKGLIRQYFEPIPFARDAVVHYEIDNTGSTNVASALQSALADCAADKRDLFMPPGRYLLGGTRIRVPSNINWFGAGMWRTVLVRDTDDTKGTVEVYESANVRIADMSIEYTPATYTLGYGQTGFAVRNGAENVELVNLGVTGKINRQFHLINCRSVRVKGCVGIGGGNAGLRVVSDFVANFYAEMSDEDQPVQVRNIWLDDCVFTGATTLHGTARSGTNYGINLAALDGVNDAVSNIWIRNCLVRYTESQAFEVGGKCSYVKLKGCHAEQIGLNPTFATPNGVAFLVQVYLTVAPQRVTFEDCSSSSAGYNFYSVGDVFYCKWIGCSAAGGGTGFHLSSGAVYNSIVQCIVENIPGGVGFRVADGATYNTLSSNHAIGCASGFIVDAASAATTSVDNLVAVGNTTANYTLNGATAGNK